MPENEDLQAAERLSEAYRSIADEIGKRIVGQQEVIEQLLIALFARGHCLLVGVPGLAKTLLIRTLADAILEQGTRNALALLRTGQES